MTPRELIFLTPYRVPGQYAQTLTAEDTSAFLNGCLAFWHPAALAGSSAPPRLASPYDCEQPSAGHLYGVPDTPPLFLPDDWDERVKTAGALAFRATADRTETFTNLLNALRDAGDSFPTDPALLNLDPAVVAPFLGVGFGFYMIEALFEAMQHENLLSSADLWQEIQAALAAIHDPAACRAALTLAADRLKQAREVLYPSSIYLLDLCVLTEASLSQPLPASFELGLPTNLLASGSLLERWSAEQPDRFAHFREKFERDEVAIVGGVYHEKEDPLLPLESQLWNLRHGLAVSKELLGKELTIFGRKRFGVHPHTPTLLASVGLQKAVVLALDDAVLPNHHAAIVSWPGPDGKQLDCFTRTPYAADNPLTYLHITHYLHRSTSQDSCATLALLHQGNEPCPWYRDLLELSRLAPVLGDWHTFTKFFSDAYVGEYASAASPDEMHSDYLSERIQAKQGQPVSWFAQQARLRRQLDGAFTLASLHQSISSEARTQRADTYQALHALETQVECAKTLAEVAGIVAQQEQKQAEQLAQRLVVSAQESQPGWLLLNPCSFARRVAVELEGMSSPLPIAGPIRACQNLGNKTLVVVEVPGWGFHWLPRQGVPGTAPQALRLKLADKTSVRNEHFEAEIDPATGGLRQIRDQKQRVPRLGQQLVYHPGSQMRCDHIEVTSSGPALGEVVCTGVLLDNYQPDKVLARFKQRYRAWLGRPLLEIRIELQPETPPEGYPWHAYYGARFAWRDERAYLFRGVSAQGYLTSHTRPETPDYLEIRQGKQNTVILPGGLPFHQKQGARMVDVILQPESETCTSFDLALTLDRDYPAQTALGLISPCYVIPTTKGPPAPGTSGWLYHLDAPNLLCTSLRPSSEHDALFLRMLECSGHSISAAWRCARDPKVARFVDSKHEPLYDARFEGDTVMFDVSPSELVNLRVDFSDPV